jgi:hypothetical protein
MLRKLWSFLKARWVWGNGRCPTCHRPFQGSPAPHDGACAVCRGQTDGLSIWCRYRRSAPSSPVVAAARPSGAAASPLRAS